MRGRYRRNDTGSCMPIKCVRSPVIDLWMRFLTVDILPRALVFCSRATHIPVDCGRMLPKSPEWYEMVGGRESLVTDQCGGSNECSTFNCRAMNSD